MHMLKSSSFITFSMLGSFEVSSLVISSKNVVFVWSCLGDACYIQRIVIVLFFETYLSHCIFYCV